MVTLRRALASDAPILSEFGWRTFRETFLEDLGCTYPPEDLQAFFDDAYRAEVFAGWIGSDAHGVWLAEQDGAVVAYAVTGPCSFEHEAVTPGAAELKRLYVSREGQGKGVAPRLMDEVLAWMSERSHAPVWLSVWSGNHRAQAFYRKWGFEKAGEYEFPVGNSRDHEFLFRRG
jgi:ribosomal protein S18 acetylase RimI-like enzyme